MSTTRARTESSFEPERISPPTFFAFSESSRPCTDIQMLCHASITTAMPRMEALKSSCPMPSATLAMASAPNATRIEPTTPSVRPVAIQRPRPAMPRVAAPTIPTMSEASRTSRKTMSAVPSMLFRDDHALGGGGVEFAHELVFARLERPHEDRRLRLARDHLLDAKVGAVELLGGRVLVLDHEAHLLPRGDLDARGREAMPLDGEGNVIRGVDPEGRERQQHREKSHLGFHGHEPK